MSRPEGSNSLAAQIEAAERAANWPEVARLLAGMESESTHQSALLLRIAHALRLSGDRAKALGYLRRAESIQADSIEVLLALAETLCELGARDQALKYANRAYDQQPRNPIVLYSRAMILLESLRLHDAVDAFRGLLDIAPKHQPGLSSLVYLLNLLPNTDPREVELEHCQRAQRCYTATPTARPTMVPITAARNRPLRIGWLSADLREHPVGRFVQPLFEQLNAQDFSLHVYSNSQIADSLTELLRQQSSAWFDASRVDDDELAARIRNDQLDLLVDLSGHTAGQRLGVLARRPAPIQISWLGYPNTTGLGTIDYRLLDPVLAPPTELTNGSEQILRLPESFACFKPPLDSPQAESRIEGPLVFGALHRLEKLNDEVINLWTQLLRRCPNAKLLMARDQLDGPRQIWLRQKFAAAGAPIERIDLRQLNSADHWTIYQEMDVLLDCFPWSGHTLACEALWMGVPVVSLYGSSVTGRLTASALRAAGFDRWIATTAEAYLAIAAQIAMDGAKLRQQRSAIRSQVALSTLCDSTRFAQNFAALLRSITDSQAHRVREE